jgi:hypothetical protein
VLAGTTILKGAKNYSGPKLSRTILSFSSSDQRRWSRIHHFEPLDLRTALFTVHKDSSQHKPQLTRRPSAKEDGVLAVKQFRRHLCKRPILPRYVRPCFE